jgi:hypothetical protein
MSEKMNRTAKVYLILFLHSFETGHITNAGPIILSHVLL